MMNTVLKIGLGIGFLLCLFEMPYGYYQFIRFVGMVSFIYLGVQDEVRQELKYFWLGSAILINPIIKISLGRGLWNVVDVIWAVVLLLTCIHEFQKRRE